jgi:O-antigen/teichoic acid export membrane protein
VATLVSVPILLGYLGLERYGIWVTATAFAAWVGIGSLGVAPSLLNQLAGIGRDRHSQRASIVAAAWWLSVATAGVSLIVLSVLDALGAWPTLFNSQAGSVVDDARLLGLAMCAGAALSMPLAIPAAVLRADQTGYLASAAEVAVTVARLLGIVVAVQLDLGVAPLAIAAVGLPALVGVAVATLVFGRRVQWPHPRLVNRATIRRILSVGLGFQGMGVAGLIISSTDVIVIAQVLGPEAVPTYFVAFSLLLLFVSLEMAVLDAMWPAYAEAAARGDGRWIAVSHRRITLGFIATASAFAIGLIILGTPIISAWAGVEAVPPPSLLVVLGVLAITQAVLLPHGRMLTALGGVHRNSALSIASAAINVPLSVALAQALGVTGVALGTLVAYLVTGGVLIRGARAALRDVGRHGGGTAQPWGEATDAGDPPAAEVVDR